MKTTSFIFILDTLSKEYLKWNAPVIDLMVEKTNDPFKILISTLLSSRTKDEVTSEASDRLFKKVKCPEDLIKLSNKQIEKIIYPVGFYKTKAKHIKELAKSLYNNYNSKVPDTLEELLKLKGVGRKTANLVISLAFNKPAICVDTHVHRISNRLGFVKSKNPDQTEIELQKKLPKSYWQKVNTLLVAFGQTLCKPIGPKCSICMIKKNCDYFKNAKKAKK